MLINKSKLLCFASHAIATLPSRRVLDLLYVPCSCAQTNRSERLTMWLQMIFALNSMLAWLVKTPFMVDNIAKWSYDYIKMDCAEDKCYGVLAVRLHESTYLYLA